MLNFTYYLHSALPSFQNVYNVVHLIILQVDWLILYSEQLSLLEMAASLITCVYDVCHHQAWQNGFVGWKQVLAMLLY